MVPFRDHPENPLKVLPMTRKSTKLLLRRNLFDVPLKTALEKMIDFIENCGEDKDKRVLI